MQLGAREHHPYGMWIPPGTRSLIVGSFPIAKFSDPRRQEDINQQTEIDFYYGGAGNGLWKFLGAAFGIELRTKTQIEKFLRARKTGIVDVIQSCRRRNGGSQDSDLKEIEWNLQLRAVLARGKIRTLYFTSKNVQRWFCRRIGDFSGIEMHVLPSPSQSAVRSQRFYPEFLSRRARDGAYDFNRFRIDEYRRIFSGGN